MQDAFDRFGIGRWPAIGGKHDLLIHDLTGRGVFPLQPATKGTT